MSAADKNAIQQADKVIEKFGGIRPMATKTGVPVTTVQGWKKRNVIPAARRPLIIEAAQTHDVDLLGLVENAGTANDLGSDNAVHDLDSVKAVVVETEEKVETHEEIVVEEKPEVVAPSVRAEKASAPEDYDFDNKLAASRKSAVTQSTYINLLLIAVVIGALFVVFWPKVENVGQSDQRITTLELDVEAVKEEQSMFRGLKLESRLEDLRARADKAQDGIQNGMATARTVSQDVLGDEVGGFKERITNLETHMNDLNAPSALTGIVTRVKLLEETLSGQELLAQSSLELGDIVNGLGGEMGGLNGALDDARNESDALGQTFEGVPQQDLKAAALLLGFSQFRSTLNRDGQPFENDLALLLKLVGDDNPVLAQSLEKLAPHAKSGVLTPAGLTNEFKSLAGDLVVSSLKGEDVSVKDKAKARMNDLFQVEKNGDLVTGTPTQATVTKTQGLLEMGDLEGAIASLKTLQGGAAMDSLPFLDQVNATLMAQKITGMITQNLGGGSVGKITADGFGATSGGTFIHDDKSGINIYVPPKPFGQ